MPGLIDAVAREHPGERVELWFMDEARVGQKGGVTHVWYQKGVRPRGVRQQGFSSAYLFGAVCPERGEGVALVLPEVSTAAMGVFLAELARAVPAGTHAALVLDGAGWHVSDDLTVPANLTLIHPPPYSPELNPVERVWEYLRDRWLSHRVLAGGHEAVVDAACAAWNALLAEPGRLRSLTNFPWLPPAVSISYSLRIWLTRAIASSTACSGVRPSTTTRWTAVLRPQSGPSRSRRAVLLPVEAVEAPDVRLAQGLHRRLQPVRVARVEPERLVEHPLGRRQEPVAGARQVGLEPAVRDQEAHELFSRFRVPAVLEDHALGSPRHRCARAARRRPSASRW